MFSVLTHNSTPQVNRFNTSYTPGKEWNAKGISPAARRVALAETANKQPIDLSLGKVVSKLLRYVLGR